MGLYYRPSKVAVIKVPLDMSGSQWGHDLTKGPDHIMKNGGLEEFLNSVFPGRLEKFRIPCEPSLEQREGQEAENLDDILRISRNVQELSRQLFDDGVFVILLGGEQTADLGLLGGAAQSRRRGKKRKLAVTSFDGHLDCNTVETTNTKHIHGQTLASHCGYGLRDLVELHDSSNPRVRPENVLVIGPNTDNIRFFTGQSSHPDMSLMQVRQRSYEQELDNARRWGIRMLPVSYFKNDTPMGESMLPEWQSHLRERLGETTKGTDGHIVLYDLDHLHELDAPGVAMPNPQGLRLHQSLTAALEVERLCGAFGELMGVAIVEADPNKDVNGKTAQAASRFIERITRNMR